jgi:hypothetical protein
MLFHNRNTCNNLYIFNKLRFQELKWLKTAVQRRNNFGRGKKERRQREREKGELENKNKEEEKDIRKETKRNVTESYV